MFFSNKENLLLSISLRHHWECCSLIPAGSSALHSCLFNLLMKERIRKVKVWDLMGWDKHNLLGKAKAVHTRKSKPRIDLLLPISRHFQESSAHVMVSWENKRHPNITALLPSSSLPKILLMSMTPYGMGYPFGLSGSAVLSVCPPNSLWISNSLLVGQHEKYKSLTVCKHWSSTTKT